MTQINWINLVVFVFFCVFSWSLTGLFLFLAGWLKGKVSGQEDGPFTCST